MLPPEVLHAAALSLNLNQAVGNDHAPKQQQHLLQDIVRGTVHDVDSGGSAIDWSKSSSFQVRRMRKRHADILKPDKIASVELTRYQWAVYSTYSEWFDGWEHFCVERGYAIWKKIFDEHGVLVSNIEFKEGKLDRIVNGDETDVPRDASKRQQGGSRRSCCVNPLLPRPGKPATKCSGHETLFLFVTANGEMFPVVLICDSDN